MEMISKTEAAKIMGITVKNLEFFWVEDWKWFHDLRFKGKMSRESFIEWWKNRGPYANLSRESIEREDRECVWFQEMPEFQEVRKKLIAAGWVESFNSGFIRYFRGRNTLVIWGYHVEYVLERGGFDRWGLATIKVKGDFGSFSRDNIGIPDFEHPGDAFLYAWGQLKDKRRPSIGNQTFEEWAFAPATEKL